MATPAYQARNFLEYRDTEHFGVTRNFLNRTEQMLKLLLAEPEEAP